MLALCVCFFLFFPAISIMGVAQCQHFEFTAAPVCVLSFWVAPAVRAPCLSSSDRLALRPLWCPLPQSSFPLELCSSPVHLCQQRLAAFCLPHCQSPRGLETLLCPQPRAWLKVLELVSPAQKFASGNNAT